MYKPKLENFKMATKKLTQAQKIRNYSDNHPTASTAEIAYKMGVRYQTVYAVLKHKPSVKVPKQLKWKMVHMSTSDESLEGIKRLEALTAKQEVVE
jgi:DNA invertase Pin-like site-specific DNA recombinase